VSVSSKVMNVSQSSTSVLCECPTRSSDTKRATWQLGDLSNDGREGIIRAQFDLSAGPSTPSLAAVRFLCEGTTQSGVDFELAGPGYRISLVKKRFLTGQL